MFQVKYIIISGNYTGWAVQISIMLQSADSRAYGRHPAPKFLESILNEKAQYHLFYTC